MAGSGPFFYDPSYGSRKFDEPLAEDRIRAYQEESLESVGIDGGAGVFWHHRITPPNSPIRIQLVPRYQ